VNTFVQGENSMGYESSLHLVDIRIKEESLPIVNEALARKKVPGSEPVEPFLKRVVIDSSGFLCFKAGKRGPDPYEPDDEGTVCALYGKWYEDEEIASWLKLHSEEGGRIILHSIESDRAAWGWEFNGKGNMRELQLCAVGKWV